MSTNTNGDWVQIHQYHMMKHKVRTVSSFHYSFCGLIICHFIVAIKARSTPIIQPKIFCDIKKEIFPSCDDADNPMPDEEGDEWLDEPLNLTEDHTATILPIADPFDNLRSEFLKDLLADSEPTTMNADGLKMDKATDGQPGLNSDGNDEDYGVQF